MLVTNKNSEYTKTIDLYLNRRKLVQVDEIRYLGIIFDNRLTFSKHIRHTAEKCFSVINMLSKTAKLQWGLGHQALKTIYNGALIPTLTYGASVWGEQINKKKNLIQYQRVQRAINIRMAKAYRTLSYEASCVLAGVEPIAIKVEEIMRIGKDIKSQEYDAPIDIKNWPHPANRRTFEEADDSVT